MDKKAQVSIEVLAILAILVIGSIIFGVYYLSMTRKNLEIAAKLDIGPELHIENGPDDPGIDDPTPPIPPTPTGLLRIEATVDSGEALVYEDFNIIVEIYALPTGYDDNTVRVTKISPAKDGGGTQDCNYNDTPIPSGGLEFTESAQILIGNVENAETSIGPIDCNSAGDYEFTIIAEMDINAQENDNDTAGPKTINEFNLHLDSPGTAPIDTNFTINADVVGYLVGKDIRIKNIKINTNGFCDYNGTPLITSGTPFNIPVPSAGGSNYAVDLNLFSCSQLGAYNFTISAGESGSTDANKNDSYSITKNITDSSAPRQLILTLDTVTDEMIMPGFEFDVLANVNYDPDLENIVIKQIKAYKSNTIEGPYSVTSECYYNNQIIPTMFGYTEPIFFPVISGEEDYNLLLNFNCCSPGYYRFDVNAGIKESSNPYENDDDNETKLTGCDYFGTGAFSNPKEIWTPKDLYCVRYYLDSNFIVVKDIDLDHSILSGDDSAYWYNDINGWDSIGGLFCSSDNGRGLSGYFNGNNKKIDNMFTNFRAPYTPYSFEIGLFKNTEESAKIYDLEINNANVLAAAAAGALVGKNDGVLENCKINNSYIKAFSTAGGLTGYNTGTIIDSSSFHNTIVGEEYPFDNYCEDYPTSVGFGGLVGNNDIGGIIKESYSISDINGTVNCGGLVGFQRQQEVPGSSGLYTIPLENSFSKGTVLGGSYVGGLIGRVYSSRYADTHESITGILNSYSTAIVQGRYSNSPSIGGLIGHVSISGDSDFHKIVRNSVWDIDASQQLENCPDCQSTGIPGYDYFGWGQTNEEMKNISTFNQDRYISGYLYFTPWEISESEETIWNIISGVNQGYPHLRNNPPPEGE